MTREEAIKFAEYAQIMADGKPDVQEFYKLAEAALRQQENPQWFSVKDGLPEADGIYIVCDWRFNGKPWIHTAGFRKASSSWCELHGVYYDDGYGRYSEQDKFTHWMPLPDPPEEADHA